MHGQTGPAYGKFQVVSRSCPTVCLTRITLSQQSGLHPEVSGSWVRLGASQRWACMSPSGINFCSQPSSPQIPDPKALEGGLSDDPIGRLRQGSPLPHNSYTSPGAKHVDLCLPDYCGSSRLARDGLVSGSVGIVNQATLLAALTTFQQLVL